MGLIYDTTQVINDETDLRDVMNLDVYMYAPMFRNTVDNMFYTALQMIFTTEEEAMSHGFTVNELRKGTGGSTVFTDMVIDLREHALRAGMFVAQDGRDFPIIIIKRNLQ